MSFGIKISKSGKEAETPKFQDIIMDATINMFKFYRIVKIKTTMPAYTTGADPTPEINVKIPHKLGYTPSFLVMMKGKTQYWGKITPQAQSVTCSDNFPYFGNIGSDIANIYLNIYFINLPYIPAIFDFAPYPSHDFYINCIIFYEELHE